MTNSTLQWLRSLDFSSHEDKEALWAILNSPQTLKRLRSIWGKAKNTKTLWRLNVFLALDKMAGQPQRQTDNTRSSLKKAIRSLPGGATTRLILGLHRADVHGYFVDWYLASVNKCNHLDNQQEHHDERQ